MNNQVALFIIGFWVLLAVFVYGAFLGRDEGVKVMKTEAVQRGFATLVSDENGNTTFTWKETSN